MLEPWPLNQLFFLLPLTWALLRVSVAVVFALAAWKHFTDTETREKAVSVLEGVIAIGLFVGFYAQYAAIAGALVACAWAFSMTLRPMPKSTVVLVLIMCVTLIITGAGPFAFDLPL